jgi:psp operon transcriptional activator
MDPAVLVEEPFKKAVWQFKLGLLKKALQTAKYNQRKAAAQMGLTYHQFRGLYRQYQSELK